MAGSATRLQSFVGRAQERRFILSQRSDYKILRLLKQLRETDDGPV